MKILVYGAGVLGTTHAARLHEAGHEVSLLARGARLAALRTHGAQLAEGDSTTVRRVAVPLVETASGNYDLILVLVRAHQLDAVVESLAGGEGDVLFLINWAGGPEPLTAALGERVLLGFPTFGGGVLDGDVVRHRAPSALDRFIAMPIGEPGGESSARAAKIVRMFRAAGIGAKAEPRMDAWLKTHAAFTLPLESTAKAAGGPKALAESPAQVRQMILDIRQNLDGLDGPPVPRALGLLRVGSAGMLVPLLRSFLRSSAAVALNTDTPAAFGELDLIAEQLRR